jgi:hypothetical protein
MFKAISAVAARFDARAGGMDSIAAYRFFMRKFNISQNAVLSLIPRSDSPAIIRG